MVGYVKSVIIQISHGIGGAKIQIVSIMDRVKFYCCFIALLFFSFQLLANETSVFSKIKTIPINERDSLEFFFKRVMASETFAFVLFGDKPMGLTFFTRTECLSEQEKKTNPLLIFAQVDAVHGRFRKGFDIWKKYHHLFSSQSYLFLEYHIPFHPETTYVFLINKKAFIDTIEKHLADFQQTLGDQVTPILLLKEIQQTKDVFKVLKHNNLLIGILFGYGRHNSLLFQKKYDFLKRFPKKKMDCPYKLQMFNNTQLPLNSFMLELPRFAADLNHPETKQLSQKYHSQLRKILKRYQSGDFLEVTLQQLCQESSAVQF